MAEYTYNYTRNLINGAYNINNDADVDVSNDTINLYKKINDDLELKDSFKIVNNGSSCDIIFNFELSGAQESTLDTIVSDYKAIT